MNGKKLEISAGAAASIGLLALASAMGIGRFSLTPILPLMQQDAGLSLTVGGWLATSNYIGYLLGALACIALTPRPALAIRWGLVGVGITTLAMGCADWPSLWLALRFLAGIASAFVLVGTSAWAMPILRRHGKEAWSGHVFSGVGIGIVFAGLFGLAAGIDAWSSRVTWIVLGVVSVALAALLWRPLGIETAPSTQANAPTARALPRPAIIAAICYGAFGFGYIIPATFLPALARGYIDDPAMFGLICRCSARPRRSRPLPAAGLDGDLRPGSYGRGRSGCSRSACSHRRWWSTCRRCCSPRCASAARLWSSPWPASRKRCGSAARRRRSRSA